MPAVANTLIATNLIGRIIEADAGRLTLVEVLGEGSYGVVFRAVEQHAVGTSSKLSPNQYAVKVLRRADDHTVEGQCQSREIVTHKIASEHPNVLTLHQVIEDGSFIYLVMDYCPGGDMYTAIVKRHAYCQNDALAKSVFVQLLDAVQACHEKSIFHRDLKPDNIFVSEDDSKVVLGDFGLATDVDISTSFSCGSTHYLSPECIGEEQGFMPFSTPASDVWALGVILTNMLVGCNPWNIATTDDEHFHCYLSDKRSLRESLPMSDAAADILDKIFTFNPRDRITIPELRKEILSVETFYPTEKQVASSASRAKAAPATYSPRIPAAAFQKVVVKDMDVGVCIFLENDPLDEEFLFASPDPDAPIPDFNPWNAFPTTTTLIEDGDSLFGDALSDCDTPESSAPVTPADTLVGDPMDLGKVQDLEGDEGENAEGAGFSIKNAIMAAFIRPSMRRMAGFTDL